MKQIYLAYGSNMNLEQMAKRCPTAKLLGPAVLKGWKLIFRGTDGGAVATIEPKEGGEVPTVLWELEPEDEAALDRYEGFPHLYRKETVEVFFKGKQVRAMVYIMNPGRELGSTTSSGEGMKLQDLILPCLTGLWKNQLKKYIKQAECIKQKQEGSFKTGLPFFMLFSRGGERRWQPEEENQSPQP